MRVRIEMIIRNFRWDDLEAVLKVINGAQRKRGIDKLSDRKEIENKLKRYFEAEKDCFVAETSNGNVVGIATMRFKHPNGTGYGVYDILPEISDQELEIELVRATDLHLKKRWSGNLSSVDQIKVERDIYDFEEGKQKVLEAEGYQLVDNTHLMVMSIEKSIDEPVIPKDIEIAFFDQEYARATYEFFQSTFNEEIGRSYENWQHHYHLDEDFFDPTWWLIAQSGNEIVGMSICYPDIYEEPQRTVWFDLIGVRADMRRKGIGIGLLRQTLINFQKRGFERAKARPDSRSLVDFDLVPIMQQIGFCIENKRSWYEKILSSEA